MKIFKPDYTISDFTKLSPEWLKANQVKFILANLTGTLITEGQEDFGVFDDWYQKIEQNGTGLIIATNELQSKVNHFIKRHKIVGYGNCGKPHTRLLEERLFEKGLLPETAVFVGSDWWTDIWCGKRLGVRTVKVNGLPPS